MEPVVSQPIFTAQICHLDGYAEVVLAGELDLASVGVLQQVLDDLFAQGQINLRLNASALTFLDAAGIGCLIGARQRASDAGGDLGVESLHGLPLRVLEVCNLVRALAN